MNYLLHIETSTTVCSVAISKNKKLLFHKEINEGFTHAENLHLFIQEGFQEAKINAQQLVAIGVSKGPGSYTGLRIGVSAAKGLAYALNIPVIGVETLQVMAKAARVDETEKAWYAPMIDARRMEVYTALYNENLEQLESAEAFIMTSESSKKFNIAHKVYVFGDGMPKCKSLLENFQNVSFIHQIYPSAENMIELVYQKFVSKDYENLAYFEPLYLKDFMVLKKKAL